jgi:S-adenosylmethionine-dependent methyltransferase
LEASFKDSGSGSGLVGCHRRFRERREGDRFFFEARKLITRSNDERFQNGAQDYASYLESPEGRLRIDLAFENLQEVLHQPQEDKALFTLDLGAGTGAMAVRLARQGSHVTLLDPSQAMLDIARRAAEETGVMDRVSFVKGDAAHLTSLFPAASFDVVLCHNVLEFVDDPTLVLRDAGRLLRDASAILSIIVRNQAGEVFKSAIQAGDLVAAETNLTSEWGSESLYGGRVRLFTSRGLRAMLSMESLALIAERGVRVLADYLPPDISRNSDYEQILKLERKLGCRPEYVAVARYTQCLARRMEKST